MPSALLGIGQALRRQTRTYDIQGIQGELIAYLINNLTPIGAVIMKFSLTVPDDTWLPLTGQTLSKADWSDLYAEIGDQFGSTSLTFNLPSAADLYPVGAGTIAAGAIDGANSMVLTVGQLPAHGHSFTPTPHSHAITDPGHTHTEQGTSGGTGMANGTAKGASANTGSSVTGITIDNASAGGTVENTGSGDSIDKRPRSIGMYWFIKAKS